MRNKINIIFFFSFLTFYFFSVKADWVQVNNGLGIWNVNAFCSYTNGGVNYLFAGTDYGGGNTGVIFVTTNNGDLWTRSSNVPASVYALAVTGYYVFDGDRSGVGYTTNNGANWYGSLGGSWIYSIAASGSNVFAGCYHYWSGDTVGVFRSTNYGANWVPTTLPVYPVLGQVYIGLGINGNYVYASHSYLGTFISTNYGANWTLSSASIAANSFAFNTNFVFAGCNGSLGVAVYKSSNNGVSWTVTSLDSMDVYSLVSYNNYIFAGGLGGFANNGFLLSTNNGATWVIRNEGLNNSGVNALCVSGNYIFAGSHGQGVYRRLLTEIVGLKKISQNVTLDYELYQNYPNPFNSISKIKIQISKIENIKLRVYDVLGKELETILNEKLSPGIYETEFNGLNFSSGLYFYQLIADNKIIDTKKMILNK